MDEEQRNQLLQGVLRPFLDNADLLKAMFTGDQLPGDRPATDTATAATAATTAAAAAVENPSFAVAAPPGDRDGNAKEREGADSRGGDRQLPRSIGGGLAAGSVAGKSGASSKGFDGSPWGYRSSLLSRGCWKVDARKAAGRDGSVELGFDSVAFEVFVSLSKKKQTQRSGRWAQKERFGAMAAVLEGYIRAIAVVGIIHGVFFFRFTSCIFSQTAWWIGPELVPFRDGQHPSPGKEG